MRILVKTLNSYLKKPLSTEEMVVAIERTEIEIEHIWYSKEAFDEKIVTARVLGLDKHPNADKLQIAQIQLGKDESMSVVCGAPNIAVGQMVAYAKPGATLIDGTKISKAKIRGEVSYGMLCSTRELGIGDDHSGIMILDPGLPVGISLCDIDFFGDIIDIKTPANRADMMSFIGIAREIAANSKNNAIIPPKIPKIEYTQQEIVNVKEIGECKRFVTAKLHVKNTTSPSWLVENLIASGVRPIHPIVDITNYVMLITGQPTHAYDAKKIQGKMQVRHAKPSDTITTLDGVERKLTKADLVIADKSGPIGLAGVMGGATTQVDEGTTEILIEAAQFDKTTIRRMALRHGLRTEASARFEKGLPLPLPVFAFEHLLFLLKDICGAEVVQEPNDQLFAWPWIQHVGLRVRQAEKFLGVKLDEKQLIEGLRARGFEAEHFSITKESRKHLDKPYVWGANYKQHGIDGFDCSYLIDYIYSLIDINVGHTALGQFEHGRSVEVDELKAGDVVFYEGIIDKSVVDHYYVRDKDGKHVRKELDSEKKVGHNGIYIGGDKVVMAAQYEYKNSKWVKRKAQGVVEVPLAEFTQNPGYLGARRYVENFNHTIAVTAPWWREDIRIEQDLFEEAGKILGYENLPATLPQLPPMPLDEHTMVTQIQSLKNILVNLGLFEIITYSFIGEKDTILELDTNKKHLEIINPMSIEQVKMRTSLLPSHLNVAIKNQFYSKESYGFFEVSRVYEKMAKGKSESWKLAITMKGSDSAEQLSAIVQYLSLAYGWDGQILPGGSAQFENGRAGQVELQIDKKPQVIGVFGQIDKKILKQRKYLHELSFGELDISAELLRTKPKKARDAANYQYVSRDFTLEIPSTVWWQAIANTLGKEDAIHKLTFLDEYNDDDLKKRNVKRYSFRLELDCGPQPSTKEIEKLVTNIIKSIKQGPGLKDSCIV